MTSLFDSLEFLHFTLWYNFLFIFRYRNFRTFASPRPAQFSCLAVDDSGEVVCAGSLDTFEIFLWSMQTGRLLEVLLMIDLCNCINRSHYKVERTQRLAYLRQQVMSRIMHKLYNGLITHPVYSDRQSKTNVCSILRLIPF
jgi:hypothetical protein